MTSKVLEVVKGYRKFYEETLRKEGFHARNILVRYLNARKEKADDFKST